jgi:hypothetical protein
MSLRRHQYAYAICTVLLTELQDNFGFGFYFVVLSAHLILVALSASVFKSIFNKILRHLLIINIHAKVRGPFQMLISSAHAINTNLNFKQQLKE